MRDWLVVMRKSKNFTQQDLADKIGITRQMISAIENGDASPSVRTARNIGNLLHFDWTRFYETKSR